MRETERRHTEIKARGIEIKLRRDLEQKCFWVEQRFSAANPGWR
jgi:hypothetical protein